MKKFVGFLVGVFVICLFVFSVREYKGQKPLPQKSETVQAKTVNITISIPVEQSANQTIPSVPPGQIYLYGPMLSMNNLSINNLNMNNVNPANGIDYSSQVVGGQLNSTFAVPEKRPLIIGDSLNNQNRVNNIRVNGELVTSYGVLGAPPYQFPVTCFTVQRYDSGFVKIEGCDSHKSKLFKLRIRATGDDNGNGKYNSPFDDLLVPYRGNPKEDIRIETSLWRNPLPGGIWQYMIWDKTLKAYSAIFQNILADQSAYFAIHHPDRRSETPGTYETAFGVFADVMDAKTDDVLCTSKLVHYLNFGTSSNPHFVAVIDGINTANGCVIQGANTMAIVIGD